MGRALPREGPRSSCFRQRARKSRTKFCRVLARPRAPYGPGVGRRHAACPASPFPERKRKTDAWIVCLGWSLFENGFGGGSLIARDFPHCQFFPFVAVRRPPPREPLLPPRSAPFMLARRGCATMLDARACRHGARIAMVPQMVPSSHWRFSTAWRPTLSHSVRGVPAGLAWNPPTWKKARAAVLFRLFMGRPGKH